MTSPRAASRSASWYHRLTASVTTTESGAVGGAEVEEGPAGAEEGDGAAAASAASATAPFPFAVPGVDVAPFDAGCVVCCLERVDIAESGGREEAAHGERSSRTAKALVDLNMREKKEKYCFFFSCSELFFFSFFFPSLFFPFSFPPRPVFYKALEIQKCQELFRGCPFFSGRNGCKNH